MLSTLATGGASHRLADLFQRAGSGGIVTVGRAADSVLVCSASTASAAPADRPLPLMVSRRHAQLQVRDGQLQLRDQETVNGTFVNSQRLERGAWKVLEEHDVVSFGGPQILSQGDVKSDNPWSYTVRRLHDFLATYVAPGRQALQASPAQPLVQIQPPPDARDCFSFSPLACAGGAGPGEPEVQQAEAGAALSRPASGGPVEAFTFSGAATRTEPQCLVTEGSAHGTAGAGSAGPPPPLVGGAADQERGPGQAGSEASSPEEVVRVAGAKPSLRPAGRAGGRSRAEPAVIDLTMDDEGGAPAPFRQVVPSWGGKPTSKAAEVVEASSPTKRRDQHQEAGHSGKRPKPDSSHAASAAAPQPAAAQAVAAESIVRLQNQLVCVVCQELLVATHSMVPCGHSYCGECIASWLQNKADCPTCRVQATAAPIRQLMTDNIVEELVSQLPPDDLAAWKDRKRSWDEKKDQLEKSLKARWERDSSRQRAAGGRSGGAAAAGRTTRLVNAHQTIYPIHPGEPGWDALARAYGHMFPSMMLMQQAVSTQPPAPPAPPAQQPALPSQQQYRVEYTPSHGAGPCTRCQQATAPSTLRVGVQSKPQNRHDRGQPWRWYHLACFPSASWANARVAGVDGLRTISESDKALVRERLVRR